MKRFTFLLITFLSTGGLNQSFSQLVIDTTLTPTQLVQNVFLGDGVIVNNIQFNCPKIAMGYFSGASSNIGMSAGMLLTTGNAFDAIGPNTSTSTTHSNGVSFNDPDLMLIEPLATNDVCIVEFDFVPDSSYMEFHYSFASEEYPEFVNSIYNDAFGFFLSGDGFTSTTNIVLIPSTTIPISVNNLNNGTICPTPGPCVNCLYYVDNCYGTTVEYDGFTTVVTAKANVTKDSTYHIKLAIADAGDNAYDAAVFFECGSFSSLAKTNSSCTFTGINNYTIGNEITLYPVPTSDYLSVTVNDWLGNEMGIEIFDLFGRAILKSQIKKSIERIDVSDFPKGVYFLKITSDGKSAIKKFVKM